MSTQQTTTEPIAAEPVTIDQFDHVPANEITAEQMLQLIDATFRNFDEGEVVEGTVVLRQPDGVLVDIGFKMEAVISRSEFSPEEWETLEPGATLQVFIENPENRDGKMVLSKEKADRMKVWEALKEAHDDETPVEGTILSRIKGGLIVDVGGVKGFLPGSQIDLRPVRDLDALIGQNLAMQVIKINRRRNNIVLSRRVLLEEERDKMRESTLSNLEPGLLIDGVVKNITDYGAFVDLGGIDGLLHITDISWGRINHPNEVLKVGEKLQVVVLRFDRDSQRVSLGLKQKTPDPWTTAAEKYPVDSRLQGRVVSLTDYGAFIELEKGVEGLCHVSEMSWTSDVKHPSKVVNAGDEVEVVVLSINPETRKISLGMKQTQPNPWDLVETNYAPGQRIKGVIRNLTDFGAFVGLPEGIDGLIHVSDISYTKHIKHPSELFQKGQEVEAVVLKVDRAKERISLGFKQLEGDPWETRIPGTYPVGSIHKAKVVKIADFGVFAELEEGVEALIPASEMPTEEGKRMSDMVTVGESVDAKVIRLDLEEQKIALSIRALSSDSEAGDMADYVSRNTSGPATTTLGSLIQDQLKKDQD
ncbi:MAG: 30S ribosomal protein S1 [Nitrospirota bacterium]|nr:30S ribosomal protein S1 [Nitrospirota bacterium]